MRNDKLNKGYQLGRWHFDFDLLSPFMLGAGFCFANGSVFFALPCLLITREGGGV